MADEKITRRYTDQNRFFEKGWLNGVRFEESSSGGQSRWSIRLKFKKQVLGKS